MDEIKENNNLVELCKLLSCRDTEPIKCDSSESKNNDYREKLSIIMSKMDYGIFKNVIKEKLDKQLCCIFRNNIPFKTPFEDYEKYIRARKDSIIKMSAHDISMLEELKSNELIFLEEGVDLDKFNEVKKKYRMIIDEINEIHKEWKYGNMTYDKYYKDIFRLNSFFQFIFKERSNSASIIVDCSNDDNRAKYINSLLNNYSTDSPEDISRKDAKRKKKGITFPRDVITIVCGNFLPNNSLANILDTIGYSVMSKYVDLVIGEEYLIFKFKTTDLIRCSANIRYARSMLSENKLSVISCSVENCEGKEIESTCKRGILINIFELSVKVFTTKDTVLKLKLKLSPDDIVYDFHFGIFHISP